MHDCGHFSLLIIQDMIILPSYLVLYCVCYFFFLDELSSLFTIYPGSDEAPECRMRDDEMPYCSLCMGNIYLSNILQIYAALLYPLGCLSYTHIVLNAYFNMSQNN